MRPNRAERKKELEFAVALRQKELEDLRSRKAALEEGLNMTAGDAGSGNLSAVFPVLDYCGAKPRMDIRTIPFEHVGSVLTQFDLASQAVVKRNQELQHEVNELNRRIRLEGKQCLKVRENTKELEHATGAQVKNADHTNGRNSLIERDNTKDASLPELKYRKTLIEKEIRMGRLLIKKKEESLLQISNMMQTREDVMNEIDALNNDIRVLDRDIKCEQEALQDLTADWHGADFRLQRAMERKENSSRLLIQEGIAQIKDEISWTVTESRQVQERVIKTQNYRIEQLERRLQCIEKALKENHLLRDVDAILTQNWASRGELMALGNDEDMYNTDKINPPQEMCHPGIHNLFLVEKERLQRRLKLFDTLAREKECVINALGCKVEALSRECQEAIQELDEAASGAAYEEEQQRIKAMEYIEEQRMRYSNLLLEKQKLKSKAYASSRRAIGK